jgi:hypothetical protein
MGTYVLVMNSNVKGAVAEQAIVLAAMKLRVPVLRPVDEHGRCDLASISAGACGEFSASGAG